MTLFFLGRIAAAIRCTEGDGLAVTGNDSAVVTAPVTAPPVRGHYRQSVRCPALYSRRPETGYNTFNFYKCHFSLHSILEERDEKNTCSA